MFIFVGLLFVLWVGLIRLGPAYYIPTLIITAVFMTPVYLIKRHYREKAKRQWRV